MTIVQQYSADAAPDSGAMALFFGLTTNPDPVRVSPSSGDAERADFVFVGSRRGRTAIECRKITIAVPTGENSPDLTPDLASASADISLKDWTPVTDPDRKTITFTPTSGYAVIGKDEGVTLQLMGMRINSVVGSAPIRIVLEWRESGMQDWAEPQTTVFDIGKFPASFELKHFMAEELIINNGGSVKLNWETTGASSLRLLYDAADVNVMNLTTYTVSNVAHSTVFYLRATVQVGTVTVERVLATMVTVLVPDLEVSNLRVTGTMTVSTPRNLTVSTNIGEDLAHPAKNMFDGSLDTYYLNARATSGDDFGTVTLDLGRLYPVHRVDVYFGRPDGSNLPAYTAVRSSVTGASWDGLFVSSSSQPEVHWTSAEGFEMRYVRVTIPPSSTLTAIRQIHVGGAEIIQYDGEAAIFDVPIVPRRGITEV